jgi:hypothetical protein
MRIAWDLCLTVSLFVCLFGVLYARHAVPHEHGNNSIACVSNNKATMLCQHQEFDQQRQCSSNDNAPATQTTRSSRILCPQTTYKSICWWDIPGWKVLVERCSSKKHIFLQRQCRSNCHVVFFQIIMARVVIMILWSRKEWQCETSHDYAPQSMGIIKMPKQHINLQRTKHLKCSILKCLDYRCLDWKTTHAWIWSWRHPNLQLAYETIAIIFGSVLFF